MDNLSLQRVKKVPDLSNVHPNSLAIDWDIRVAFFIADSKICSLNLSSDEVTFLHDLLIDSTDFDIICSNFLLEEKLYFILFQNGKIVTYDSPNKELFEHSIDISSSIDNAVFSNDQELLVVVTRDNQMLLFNKIMILQVSYDMNKLDYGINELVNVNWGSKSTQFHGEGMRDKRVVKEEYYPLTKWDDSKSCIDWRGDDNHFVVNFVCSKSFRLLKLFNRQGILQHTSEYIAGLEKNIAWKPAGGLIAASQTLPNKHSVIFFEKNGLKHGELDLPYSPGSYIIAKLSWSHDSDILLVCGYEVTSTEESYQKVRQNILLFTQSNYHWYLKQKFELSLSDYAQNILWDEQQYSLLHFLTSNGTYYSHCYRKLLNSSPDGKMLVIDANRVNISDFDRTLIPPPMCTYSICFEDQVMQLSYSDIFLAVIINGDRLIMFKYTNATLAECTNLGYPISYDFSHVFSDFMQVYLPFLSKKIDHISEMTLPIVLKDGRIFGIIDKRIVCFDYTRSEQLCTLVSINEPISALANMSNGKLLLASESGQLYCYDIETNSCGQYDSNTRYDDSPSRLLIHTDHANQSHIVTLTARNSLYYDQTLILSSIVNSVELHDRHLLFATTDSLFYCWPLLNFDPLALTQAYPPRTLERGAKIISTSYSQAKVVLQMPRGNLEAFHPRTLLLDQVQSLLEKLDFLEAFEILRKHRINLNYMCDYDFNLFTQNCGLFIEQIGLRHVDWICLFLSELCSENVLTALNKQADVNVPNKVDAICELLLSTMLQMDRIKFINPILLTYIKRQKPQIEKALQTVKHLPNNKLRDEAIKFLLYVVNVNRLFDEALGTYEFDIVLMVAAKSNKDPKEYLPMLNEFKAIENEHYRKYKIDIHLQKWERALLHLSKCENRFEEALELIEERRLYKDAIEIYQLNSSPAVSSQYRQIWELYGQYLFKKKYYREAAIAFKRAENHSQAFKMYLMDSNWNMASVCARRLSDNADEFQKMLHSVSQQLILNGNYIAGSFILEHYLKNYKESFLALVKGHEWDCAMRCFHDYKLEEALFDDELKSELINSYEFVTAEIDRKLLLLEEHLTRLKEVKETRTSRQQGMVDNIGADLDSYSDTSSVFDTASLKSSDSSASVSSLKTNRTNNRMKHQKRLEHKRYILKKGSANEDIQLVYAIKELIGQCKSLFEESGSLTITLYDLFLTEQSKTLQHKLHVLRSKIVLAKDFIWSSEYFERRLAEDETLRSVPESVESNNKWELILE